MNIKEVLEFLKRTIEANFLALSQSLRGHVFTTRLESDKVEVSNPFKLPDIVRVQETKPISYKKDIQDSSDKVIKSFENQIKLLQKTLLTLTPSKSVEVSNLSDIPKPHQTIRISNPQKSVSVSNFYELQTTIGKFQKAVEALKLDPKIVIPEIKVPDVYVPEIKIPTIKNEIDLSKLEKILGILSKDPEKPLSVRLSDGKKFYKALEELNQTISGGGGKSYSFQDADGERTYGLVDEDQHVQVDVLSGYETNDVDLSDDPIRYECQENKDGEWLFVKIDPSNASLRSFRFATIKNNPTKHTYTQAYSSRKSLTYGYYSQAF